MLAQVIYNTAAAALIGRTPQSAIWASNTAGAANGPFKLLMQQVGSAPSHALGPLPEDAARSVCACVCFPLMEDVL